MSEEKHHKPSKPPPGPPDMLDTHGASICFLAPSLIVVTLIFIAFLIRELIMG